MGVARRKDIPLKSIRVEIVVNHLFPSKAEAVDAAAEALKAPRQQGLKKVTLHGTFTDRQFRIMRNAAKHCPVGRMFENGLVEFVHEFELVER